MDEVLVSAPAKLNLRLVVGPVRPDGYHPLRTLMVALDGLCDDVVVRRAGARSVACPGVAERDNLAWRALEALEGAVGRPLPVHVEITKRIPAQAGLGGGSSDAAATLVGVDRLYGLGLGPDRLEEIAAAVGSDVPFFVRGGVRWAGGRGEVLAAADPVAFAAVLVKPPVGLPTGAVYHTFDRLGVPPPDDGATRAPSMPRLAAWVRNDLWPAALALAPALGAPARALAGAGARRVLLCGSGSCLAGLCDDAAHARAVAERLPPAVRPLAVVEPVRA